MRVTSNNAKKLLREGFSHTIKEIDLVKAMERFRSDLEAVLSGYLQNITTNAERVRLIAFGKAAVPMTSWLIDTFELSGIRVVISAPRLPQREWAGFKCFAGGHPVPNKQSLQAARAALEIANAAVENDLVLFLMSGGGSALMELPFDDSVSLRDTESMYGTLVTCGADIVETNVIRKHLSRVKGGRLALAASPARQVTLYVSDVPEGCESSVASGPTMPDESTLEEFRQIAERYELRQKLPASVIELMNDSTLPDTPKPGDPAFRRSAWSCVLANRHAVDAMRRFADNAGWKVVVDDSPDDLEISTAADVLLKHLGQLRETSPGTPVCVISGGELRSPVVGSGVGGRNQAFVLECVPRIAGEKIAVLSAGTDGIDGNSPAAGALADGSSAQRAKRMGLDSASFSRNSDSYSFFKRLGDDITCGPTGNNVRDIRVLLSWE
ncbi:MAG: DUF4147 domain-containing protein [Candidatus Latescibacteria bacterium]|nr:DUF4147 domain-containing protein [Candidatus Latescibacterota bacterium]NIM64416.1 DUF4147 domain-containing protein [Candidatus Latescibacterota bacterium]NIO00570.1 DUF4147 domain-containing protein [Candidatus Latescibacterota bacterium]NIO26970.1 DUF4147 domain-containing protein [Candidatus Latescibacterota bacterium]NIO56047.1 DUF4147 domain-containing protein [Candidatus Latescibacterota bacterium]